MKTKPSFKILNLPSFSVVGKLTSTKEGPGSIERVWNEAENQLKIVSSSVLFIGCMPSFWGLMSDFSLSFAPWENDFKEGLYLAGFELKDPSFVPPEGWVKWDVKENRYLVYEVGEDYQTSFKEGLDCLKNEGYVLSGAAFDHLENGVSYIYYPIEISA